MTERFGGGIYLTNNADDPPNWDFQVDESGDIRTVRGQDELHKDVAYGTAIRVGFLIGERATPETRNKIKQRVRTTLNQESRVDSITSISVRDADTDKIEVVVIARANEDEVEFVFEVDK